MMISPETFVESYMDKPYEELLKIRDDLVVAIKRFEAGDISNEEMTRDPAPDFVYQMNLEYLGKLCEMIAEKYRKEFVWHEEDE